MRTFHHVDEHRTKLPLHVGIEKRLPIGQSMAMIGGLSVLAWGVVVLFIMAVRTIFF